MKKHTVASKLLSRGRGARPAVPCQLDVVHITRSETHIRIRDICRRDGHSPQTSLVLCWAWEGSRHQHQGHPASLVTLHFLQ
jgi:hypothetical protein